MSSLAVVCMLYFCQHRKHLSRMTRPRKHRFLLVKTRPHDIPQNMIYNSHEEKSNDLVLIWNSHVRSFYSNYLPLKALWRLRVCKVKSQIWCFQDQPEKNFFARCKKTWLIVAKNQFSRARNSCCPTPQHAF